MCRGDDSCRNATHWLLDLLPGGKSSAQLTLFGCLPCGLTCRNDGGMFDVGFRVLWKKNNNNKKKIIKKNKRTSKVDEDLWSERPPSVVTSLLQSWLTATLQSSQLSEFQSIYSRTFISDGVATGAPTPPPAQHQSADLMQSKIELIWSESSPSIVIFSCQLPF